MKKLFVVFLSLFILLGTGTAFAASKGAGGTYSCAVYMKSLQSPGWIQLLSDKVGFPGATHYQSTVCGVYDIYLEGKFYGKLGGVVNHKYGGVLRVNLPRGKSPYALKIVYNEAETRRVWKQHYPNKDIGVLQPRWGINGGENISQTL